MKHREWMVLEVQHPQGLRPTPFPRFRTKRHGHALRRQFPSAREQWFSLDGYLAPQFAVALKFRQPTAWFHASIVPFGRVRVTRHNPIVSNGTT
jgi:hypothetical protein